MGPPLSIEPSARALIDTFRKDLAIQAEGLVATFFPQKLEELDTLLKSSDLNILDLSLIRAELDIPIPDPAKDKREEEEKKKKEELKKETEKETDKEKDKEKDKDKDDEDSGPPCGPVPGNDKILALLNIIKPQLRLLKEKSYIVTMWIQLQIPKIEDGNNFGVAVQEKVFELMTSSRTKVEGFQTQITKYFLDRGDAVAKAAKQQHVLPLNLLPPTFQAARSRSHHLAA
uniref:proteasome activator complex subunit 1-like n=1 Tax=Pristiophorus japonicus TaxID=55135 RepID=UPI00398F3BC4